jgi:hypothetical protein
MTLHQDKQSLFLEDMRKKYFFNAWKESTEATGNAEEMSTTFLSPLSNSKYGGIIVFESA